LSKQTPPDPPWHCTGCDQDWWPSLTAGCPRCEYGVKSVAPPEVWNIGQIPDFPLWVGPHIPTPAQMLKVAATPVEYVVDIAGDHPAFPRLPLKLYLAAGLTLDTIPDLVDVTDGRLAWEPHPTEREQQKTLV
jgi:hypothetical protein